MFENPKGLAEFIESAFKYPTAVFLILTIIFGLGFLAAERELSHQWFKYLEARTNFETSPLPNEQIKDYVGDLSSAHQRYRSTLEFTSDFFFGSHIISFIGFVFCFILRCVTAVNDHMTKKPQKRSSSWRLPRNKPPS